MAIDHYCRGRQIELAKAISAALAPTAMPFFGVLHPRTMQPARALGDARIRDGSSSRRAVCLSGSLPPAGQCLPRCQATGEADAGSNHRGGTPFGGAGSAGAVTLLVAELGLPLKDPGMAVDELATREESRSLVHVGRR